MEWRPRHHQRVAVVFQTLDASRFASGRVHFMDGHSGNFPAAGSGDAGGVNAVVVASLVVAANFDQG